MSSGSSRLEINDTASIVQQFLCQSRCLFLFPPLNRGKFTLIIVVTGFFNRSISLIVQDHRITDSFVI